MMPFKFDCSPYRSVLCLNGTLPDRTFFLDLKIPIIAADGAANTLHEYGLSPHIIIGDLDSVRDPIREKNRILHYPEQNSSDYQKSLRYLAENDLLPTLVLGINGGHLDHILNNINIFLETESVLYAPPLMGCVLKSNVSREFSLPPNTKISLLGIPSASVSSKGLKWELNQMPLSFPGNNSCFNRTQDTSVQLKVHDGSALVLIYMEPADDAGKSNPELSIGFLLG